MKKTKKITALFLLICMALAFMPAYISAEVIADPGTLEGWSVEGSGEITAVFDDVGKLSKPVMKYTGNDGENESKIIYSLGKLKEGLYELEIEAKFPGSGNIRFGIADNLSGAFPAGTSDYTKISADVTVTDSNAEQKVVIEIDKSVSEYYISEVIFRKKTINTVYSDNLIENNNFSERIPSYKGWETDSASSLKMVTDTVDGVERPVLEWTYNNKSGTTLVYEIGKLPVGFYELSAYVRSPNNPGEGRMGLMNDAAGGFPDNSPQGTLPAWTKGYTRVSRVIEIAGEMCNLNNSILFYNAWGDAPGCLYLADVSVKKIEYSEDGLSYITVGDNYVLNHDFHIYDTKGVTTGWDSNVNKTYTKTASTRGWVCSNETDSVSTEIMTVNGVEKTCLKWHFVGKEGNLLQYELGQIPIGTYEITGKFYTPKNPGHGRVGLYYDAAGGFPDNAPKYTLYRNTDFESFTRVVEVNETASKKNNKLLLMTAWGSSEGDIYFSDISMRKIQYNEDGETYNYAGDNMIENGQFVMIEEVEDADAATVLSTEFKQIGREERNVLKWDYNGLSDISASERILRYKLGDIEEGRYEVSVTALVNGNPGETEFGIGSKISLDYPIGDIDVNQSDYITYTDIFDISDSLLNKYFIIQSTGEWTEGNMEISEVSVRKMDYVPSYGLNLIDNWNFMTDARPSLDYWEISGGYGHEIYQKTINGEVKNVLEVCYAKTTPTTVIAKTASISAGTYKITANVCSPNNAGKRGFGVAVDTLGSFPGNVSGLPEEERLPFYDSEWKQVSRTVTVPNDVADSFVGFYAIWGSDAGSLYISDVSMQEVYEDGSLGENLVINPDFTVVEPEYEVVLSEEIKEPVDGFLKVDTDIYFDGKQHSNIGIDVEDGENKANVITIATNTMPVFGVSGVDETFVAGWYHVSAKLEIGKSMCIITVTTPDGKIVQRGHYAFLGGIEIPSAVTVKTTQLYENVEDIIKNLKINYSDASDIPDYLSPLNVNLYQGDTEVTEYTDVPVDMNKISVNLVSPILDEKTVQDSVYVTKTGSDVKLNKASQSYSGGVYTMELSDKLETDTKYTVHVDKTLSAASGDTLLNDFTFEFETVPQVSLVITNIVSSSQISNLSQLQSGKPAYAQMKYTNIEATEQSYTVMAIYYGKNQQLKKMQVLKTEIMPEGTVSKARLYSFSVGDLTDVEEIRFVAWDSLDTMNPLSTVYALR